WRDVSLVRETSKIRDKGNSRVGFGDNPSPVDLVRSNDFLKHHAPVLPPVLAADVCLNFNRLKHEISGVDLAMIMGIGNPTDVPLVLEDQDMIDFRAISELTILLLPASWQSLKL